MHSISEVMQTPINSCVNYVSSCESNVFSKVHPNQISKCNQLKKMSMFVNVSLLIKYILTYLPANDVHPTSTVCIYFLLSLKNKKNQLTKITDKC